MSSPIIMPTRAVQKAGLAVAAIGAATLAGAWFFQLVVGLAPCPLCLDQRLPYYFGVPLALVAVVLARRGNPAARTLLTLVGVMMASGALLAAYHAGVEWHWWAGPATCSGSGPVQSGNILSDLQTARVVRCDEAPWRLAGISLAGFNAAIAALLAAIAFRGAFGGYGSSSVSQ